jgi:pSer/pThr/pTyr-binding forkhead associated (FHA) protein
VLAEFELGPGVYVLGRGGSCEISVDLEGLSEEHARLDLGETVLIEDLSSGAGTYVDGERVEGKRRIAADG